MISVCVGGGGSSNKEIRPNLELSSSNKEIRPNLELLFFFIHVCRGGGGGTWVEATLNHVP